MIQVLRLGHRIPRDERISTHCALVSRVFGANGLYYSGMKDKGLEESVSKVIKNFGGNFFVKHTPSSLNLIKKKKKQGFFIIHLTMYGINFKKSIKNIKDKKKVLLIIGGKKVSPEFYKIADLNLAIGNQPHSEVSALAVFLYETCGIKNKFENAKIRITGSKKGKNIKRF